MPKGVHGSGVHGTHSTYSAGCRCDPCRVAHRDYCRMRRAKAVAGYVPVERVQPLVRFLVRRYGSLAAAERAAGFSQRGSLFSRWERGEHKRVQRKTALRIQAFVMCHKPGPRDAWATFDVDNPRPPTQWERERAELYATEEYRRNRDQKRYSPPMPGDVTAIDVRVRNRIDRQRLRERQREMAS